MRIHWVISCLKIHMVKYTLRSKGNNNNNNNGILRPKAHTKAIQTTITSHTHTHTHTHTYIIIKNYMPPKYTYQKAENQTIGTSFALSLSPYSLTHRCRSHAVLQKKK